MLSWGHGWFEWELRFPRSTKTPTSAPCDPLNRDWRCYPLAQNHYITCRKNCWGIKFLHEYMRGLYLHSCEYRKYFWEFFSQRFTHSRGEFFSVWIYHAPVLAPARMQEKSWWIFMYWFREKGVVAAIPHCGAIPSGGELELRYLRIIFPPPTPKSADFTFWTWVGKKSPY